MVSLKLCILSLCFSLTFALYRLPIIKVEQSDQLQATDGKEHLERYYNAEFYGEISIGNPPQCFNVTFDTTSSSIWVGGSACDSIACFLHKKFDCSSSKSCKEEKTKIDVPTLLDPIKGVVTHDKLCFGCQQSSLCVETQDFAQAVSEPDLTYAFTKYDGVFGLGFDSQAVGNMATFITNLIKSNQCDEPVFAFYFMRGFDNATDGGELTICGIDKNQYEGELTYLPIAGGNRWQVKAESVSLGDDTAEGSFTLAFGTGSQSIYAPSEFVEIIYSTIGAKVSWNGQYTIDCKKVDALPNFTFRIKGQDYVLGPWDYIYKIQDTCSGAFVTSKTNEWVLGNTFMNRYYTVFDLGNKRIGLAKKK